MYVLVLGSCVNLSLFCWYCVPARLCCRVVACLSILSCPSLVARFRCSIVRLLQWRTTLVKRRSDPSRYVIDLKNNADAPAAQHKTAKYYRRAVLPLPKLMTAFLDDLRASRKVSGTRSHWVFVNTKGESYSTSEHTMHSQSVCHFHDRSRFCEGAWTAFVKACFKQFSSSGNGASPNGSLTRSIFVTFLNNLPRAYIV